MKAEYTHAGSREGIRELVAGFRDAGDQLKSSNVFCLVHSLKWIHLIAAGCEPPRAALIRPYNDFTVGYTTQVPLNLPDLDIHVEVVRTDDGRLFFREDGQLLTACEFAIKLIRLVAARSEPGAVDGTR